MLPAAFLIGTALHAENAPEFAKDIRPILEKHCFECHGDKKQKSGLRMDRRADFLKGGDSAKAPFEPGKSAESDMVKRILSDDDDEKMPPKGARVPAEQVAKIKAWIDAGALIADDGSASAAKHWAYVKPEAKPPPEIRNPQSASRNGIDQWVLARLKTEGLKPSAEADSAVLLRRVSLDRVSGLRRIRAGREQRIFSRFQNFHTAIGYSLDRIKRRPLRRRGPLFPLRLRL